jgi:hypothetical protein
MVILQPFLLGFELVHRDFMTKTILPRYMIFNIYIYIYTFTMKGLSHFIKNNIKDTCWNIDKVMETS